MRCEVHGEDEVMCPPCKEMVERGTYLWHQLYAYAAVVFAPSDVEPAIYTQADRDVLVARIRELEAQLEAAKRGCPVLNGEPAEHVSVGATDNYEYALQAEREKREEAE